jgi:hypothetical protein
MNKHNLNLNWHCRFTKLVHCIADLNMCNSRKRSAVIARKATMTMLYICSLCQSIYRTVEKSRWRLTRVIPTGGVELELLLPPPGARRLDFDHILAALLQLLHWLLLYNIKSPAGIILRISFLRQDLVLQVPHITTWLMSLADWKGYQIDWKK